jgi:hypothetical protein
MTLAVSHLFVYPVKSCRGIALSEAEIVATGFRHDRAWMIVDADGEMITQREEPRLALIRAAFAGGRLTLSATGQPDLAVPEPTGAVIAAEVFGNAVAARPVAAEADAWLTCYLGAPCRLVALSGAVPRKLDPRYARAGDTTGFADGYPFLVFSEASLDDLNRRIGKPPAPLPLARFRPNIVVRGAAPFAEDGWKRIRIGLTSFRVVKPCARCAIPTVDPETAATGKEPLKTLATFRRGADGAVFFGQNVIHDGSGTIRVGDPITILE